MESRALNSSDPTRRRLVGWLWAIVAGLAAGGAFAWMEYASIRRHLSSTAGIGILFIPITAAPVVALGALWGRALFAVICPRRGVPVRTWKAILAWILTLGVPAAVAVEVARGLRLQAAVHETATLDATGLDLAFRDSPLRTNKYFLGAVAGNPNATGDLLDRIASLDDESLFRRMGSRWDVMEGNQRGLAVMRLVIQHDHVRRDTLERLETSPHADEYILHDILRHRLTSDAVLSRYGKTSHYLLKWALAENPNTPIEILQTLARDSDRHTADKARATLDNRVRR